MSFIQIKDIVSYIDKEITTCGWITKIRTQKKLAFLTLTVSGLSVQVIADITLFPKELTEQSFTQVTGIIKKLPEGKYSMMPVEIQATEVTPVSTADFKYRIETDQMEEKQVETKQIKELEKQIEELDKKIEIEVAELEKRKTDPLAEEQKEGEQYRLKSKKIKLEKELKKIQKSVEDSKYLYLVCPSDAGPEKKLEMRHIYMRDQQFVLFTKCRAALTKALRQFFEDTNCTEIHPPIFTATECEGGATLFKVEHPGKSTDKPITAFLTQSSQFALELAVPAVGHAYCIAPSFRAEHSHTRRHLTEFMHAEAEWYGIMTFEDHIQKLKELMQGTVKNFLELAKDALSTLGQDYLNRVIKLEQMTKDIMILDHKDAIKMCRDLNIYKNEETKEHFGDRDDIPEMQERQLIDKIDKIVFLCRFPREFKSFYMGLDPDSPDLVLGVDVEVPGTGEIIGSGVREYDHDRLKARMLEAGLKPSDYTEYLHLRQMGFGRTSGMGLGLDRMLSWLLGTYSIRDVVTFPRFPGYLRP